MKTSSAIIAASALAASASAQSFNSIAENALGYLSGGCISTVLNMTNSQSPLYQCLDGNLIASIVTSNSSIIEPVGNYLNTFCSSQPCSNATLTAATQNIISGCASDLQKFGVTNQTVEWAVAQYPLARDVLCLKTSNPNVTSSTNSSSSANSTSSGYSTSSGNGTFCAVSLLNEFQGYLGEPLTPKNIATVALGGNSTASKAIQNIPKTALCNECIFGALSLVEEQYPQLGNMTIGNYTLNQGLEGVCNKTSSGFNLGGFNGSLPTNITESAVNSTLNPVNVTLPQSNITNYATALLPSASGSAASGVVASVTSELASATSAAGSSVNAVKKRWIGQQ